MKLVATLAIVASLTTGCANRMTANVSPSTDLSALRTMYVKHNPSDNSGVNSEIADKLRSKGVTVAMGSEAPSRQFDAIVTYLDKWVWDMSMYMLELTITIRDPKTESPKAMGNSYHTSLTRKSQTEMVNEVIDNIYNSPKNSIVQNAIQIKTIGQQELSPLATGKESDAPMAISLPERLQTLKSLKDNGTITNDEYENKRKKIIDEL
ncbi:MAG: SHOCT domain-containing protein [Burkholderiaceae bacterium]|nr:SHOCT domain-containing protein [Burkholderiaceae bacterium]